MWLHVAIILSRCSVVLLYECTAVHLRLLLPMDVGVSQCLSVTNSAAVTIACWVPRCPGAPLPRGRASRSWSAGITGVLVFGFRRLFHVVSKPVSHQQRKPSCCPAASLTLGMVDRSFKF